MKRLAIALFATTLSGPLLAQAPAPAPPLTRAELAACAVQVQKLRGDSGRLMKASESLEARRLIIVDHSAQLKAQADGTARDDLRTGLALQQQRKEWREDAKRFNMDIEQFKLEVFAINELKADYDRDCSGRPFRHADLDTLPDDQRAAMRAGLADVQVPYIELAPAAR